jgi:hypothetical protein
MTDLVAFGGPASACYAKKVLWERDTSIISVSAATAQNTSTDQQNKYLQLANRDGYAWKMMCEKGGFKPENLGSLGIAGFSAFHGFANAFLKNDEDYSKCCYVHLADACFLGAGATEPHAGYARFATEAAAGGDKLMVATTNGPWDQALNYSWTYPDGTTSHFNLTSGAQCFRLVWNAATAGGLSVSTPDVPDGMPPATSAMRVGNLLWFHYENMVSGLPAPCGGEITAHGWHCNVLSIPFMQKYGAPWMAGKGHGGVLAPLESEGVVKAILTLGVAGLIGYLLVKILTRRS